MIMYPAIRNLLAASPRALRALHDVAGYDFEQHFAAFQIDGKFTPRSVYETLAWFIPDAKNKPGDYKTVILMHSPDCMKYEKYKAVEIFPGGVDIELTNRSWPCREAGIHAYYRKCDFERMRKDARTVSIVIAQDKKLLRKKRSLVQRTDFDGRFAVSKDKHFIFPYGFDGKSKILYHNSPFDYFHNAPEDVLDKSGYFLARRRYDLKQHANERRIQKQQAAFIASDWTASLSEIKKLFGNVKNNLALKLSRSESYEDLSKTLYSLTEFRSIVYEYSSYCDRITNKKYSSIDQAVAVYKRLKEKLEKLQPTM